MSRTARSLFAVIAVGLAVCAGCGGADSGSANYSGTWVGSTSNLPAGNVLTFTLQDTDGVLSGSGTLTAAGESLTGSISGTVSGSDFGFQWDAVGSTGIGTTAIQVNGVFDSEITATGTFVPASGPRAGFQYHFTLSKQ